MVRPTTNVDEREQYEDDGQPESSSGGTGRPPEDDEERNNTEFINKRLAYYEKYNLKDLTLWEYFIEDFEGWSVDMFQNKPTKDATHRLRDHLRSHGVFVPKNGAFLGRNLCRVLEESEYHDWTEQEIEAQIKYSRLDSDVWNPEGRTNQRSQAKTVQPVVQPVVQSTNRPTVQTTDQPTAQPTPTIIPQTAVDQGSSNPDPTPDPHPDPKGKGKEREISDTVRNNQTIIEQSQQNQQHILGNIIRDISDLPLGIKPPRDDRIQPEYLPDPKWDKDGPLERLRQMRGDPKNSKALSDLKKVYNDNDKKYSGELYDFLNIKLFIF